MFEIPLPSYINFKAYRYHGMVPERVFYFAKICTVKASYFVIAFKFRHPLAKFFKNCIKYIFRDINME